MARRGKAKVITVENSSPVVLKVQIDDDVFTFPPGRSEHPASKPLADRLAKPGGHLRVLE